MKKNKFFQFFLITIAIILFFFTYYFSNDKEKVTDIDIDQNTLIEDAAKSGNEISNIIENANYNGTDNRGTFFKLNANLAQVFKDKPKLSNMKVVDAVINLRDGRKIYIKSDYAVYDKSTNNTNFMGNILVTESNNKITSDNLDLIMSDNLITVYNNVKYNGEKGFLIADKVDIDILKNESNIFMFDKKNKVQIKYKD